MRSAPEGMPWKGSQLFAKYRTSVSVERPDTINTEALTKNLLSQDKTMQDFKPEVHKNQTKTCQSTRKLKSGFTALRQNHSSMHILLGTHILPLFILHQFPKYVFYFHIKNNSSLVLHLKNKLSTLLFTQKNLVNSSLKCIFSLFLSHLIFQKFNKVVYYCCNTGRFH